MQAAKRWWQLPGAWALIAGNLVPLAGVLFWQWNILYVMTSFWLQSVVIVVYCAAKVWKAADLEHAAGVAFGGLMFLAILLVFLAAIFSGDFGNAADIPRLVWHAVTLPGLHLVVVAAVLSEGVAFFLDFVPLRAQHGANPDALSFAAAERIFTLWLVVMVAGVTVKWAGGVPGLVVLLAVKSIDDVWAHTRERRRRDLPVLSEQP